MASRLRIALACPAWQFGNRCAHSRRFAAMGFRTMLDFDILFSIFLKLTDHAAIKEDHITIGVMVADLALALVQKAIITNPVGDLMSQPRTALWSIIIGTNFEREFFIPMHPLRAFGHIEAVIDA
jgi:hypothetical protein